MDRAQVFPHLWEGCAEGTFAREIVGVCMCVFVWGVCVCVCMYVCVYVCMYVCMNVCACEPASECKGHAKVYVLVLQIGIVDEL